MDGEQSVLERLVRLEVKLDLALNDRADHETRLRKVERWMYLTAGLIGAVSGYLGQMLGQL